MEYPAECETRPFTGPQAKKFLNAIDSGEVVTNARIRAAKKKLKAVRSVTKTLKPGSGTGSSLELEGFRRA